ncbi:regulator [Streptomyces polygonati]|uniref:Regulator n=1 Tax=Streptomyces polygonati TaxID=1617087 RepID=A0ABV8HUN8_9ACTN
MSATPRSGVGPAANVVHNELVDGVAYGPSIQAGTVQAVHFHGAQVLPPTPRELPATPQVWVDREDDLHQLIQACCGEGEGIHCVAISGPGGIGKSALAIRLLRSLGAAAGSAQLYVDLRGHPGGVPLRPVEVLSRFLRAFGYGTLPSDVEELSAWWRSATAERHVTVLADNARDADQIRPLLPARPGSLIVVTSRHPLADLVVDGAALHNLLPLPENAAIELLTRCSGLAISDGDIAAATRITRMCARNPLALRTAAARSVLQPRTTLTQLAPALHPASAPSVPHDQDKDEGAVVDSLQQTYQALSADVASTFRLLGALPAHTFDPDVVAAVRDIDHTEATRLLEQLLSAELVQDRRPDDQRQARTALECSFHDVVADLARREADSDPPSAQQEARRRWVEWYLLAATQAEERLAPSHRSLRRSPRYVLHGRALFDGMSDRQVLAWLEHRRSELLSAVHTAFAAGWYDLTWQITDAMWPLFLRGRHTEDWISVHEEYGLPAAERDGDPRVVRRMLTTLGGGLRSAAEYDRALIQYELAWANARQNGHRRDEAQALDGIGACHQQAGRAQQAVPPLLEALSIREEIGYDRGTGLTRIRLAEAFADQGDLLQALDHLEKARTILLEIRDAYDGARALALLGRTNVRDGRIETGEICLQQAAEEFAATGSHHWRARILEWLGEAARYDHRLGQAGELFTASRELYATLHSPRDVGRLDTALHSLETGGSTP